MLVLVVVSGGWNWWQLRVGYIVSDGARGAMGQRKTVLGGEGEENALSPVA